MISWHQRQGRMHRSHTFLVNTNSHPHTTTTHIAQQQQQLSASPKHDQISNFPAQYRAHTAAFLTGMHDRIPVGNAEICW
eukprot:m.128827 g.128827  ORF g.128827 m.128827 type:complete len:80 (+) comp15682_c0_seq2:1829-2068(+)